ncbi:SCP-2 sterol transfer family protein [Marinobacterium lacunae]|uniref:SCP-2 sterol transfer family protein n=1 Tax=Marinobacterium lacunae TaxID=1232683 RepID=A0A081FU16_9GAMM|nr:SCP2 sterol-binding domain-containing protein [Marinobacterium lacunae]KEA62021.1 SCP-2 sterol transfer family protein [Marinobacterium lacunae]MBR9882996.1 SCP2 sterol-binding domain-containing protein [Oceanospirillales bacterium]
MSTSITVEQIIDKLPSRFNPDQAGSLCATFQFRLSDAKPFYISIADQQCLGCPGEHQDPDITLHMDEATLIRVVTGEQDGMSAFMKGQLRAEGNVMLATRLGKLFSGGKS